MALLDQIKNLGSKIAGKVIQQEHSIPLPEPFINEQLAKGFGEDSPIRSVSIKLNDGFFSVDASVRTDKGLISVKGDLEIADFLIDARKQAITLRLRDALSVKPESWLTRIALNMMAIVLKVLFGKSLMQWGAKDLQGLRVERNQIFIDLAKMGAADMILDSIQRKLGKFGDVLTLLPGDHTKWLERIAVCRAEVSPGLLKMFVVLKAQASGSGESKHAV